MNKIIFISFIFISFSLYAEDKIVAKINNKPIYESQIKNKVNDFLEINGSIESDSNYNNLEPNVKEGIIKSIILGDLILEEARKNKLNQSKEYLKALKFTEDQLLQKFFVESLVKKEITEELVLKEYNLIKKEYETKHEYKVSHILVATEKEAKDIEQKLKQGEKFSELAKKNSLDTSKNEDGSLDYFTEGQMVEPFEKEVLKLNINEISQPVKTDFGYHIIRLEDKRAAKVPSFEELKVKISEELATAFVEKYLKELELNNKVEFLK